MKRVIIVQRVLTAYRVPFYEQLKKRLEKEGIKLELIHGSGDESDRKRGYLSHLDWANEVKEVYLKIGSSKIVFQPYLRLLKGADLVIVQQEMKWILNHLLFIKRKVSGTHLAFWGHGSDRQLPPGHFLNRVKRRLIGVVDWWFAYTQSVAEDVHSSGFPEERITVVQNTIDIESLLVLKKEFPDEELAEFRKKFALRKGKTGLFCGGMHSHKRIDFLLQACHTVKKTIPDFQMIFVGDGSERLKVERAAQKNNWIHWLGPSFGKEKAICFLSADIILMPGMVGLVVLDSFAFGRPIVTTIYPFHSPEFDYLINGENGIITKDDQATFSAGVANILADPLHLGRLKANCSNSADKYRLSQMVDNFAAGIEKWGELENE